MIPEPSIQELIQIAARAVRGEVDKNADFVRGSDYEALIGPAAMIWSRQAQRDTDLFNAVNFHTADGDDLTQMGLKRYGKPRVLDTRGTGIAVLSRPAGGVSETIWKGTRFMVPGAQARFYRAAENKVVASAETAVQVKIEAIDPGPGVAISIGPGEVKIADELEDNTWTVSSLSCTDGTLFEKANEYRERIRRERLDGRVGHAKQIIKTCQNAGAGRVVVFRSNYAGDAYDHGLNVCYVGDLGNVGTPSLVKACTLALDDTRVAGDHLQVLMMARAELNVDADVYLYGAPALFDLARLEQVHYASVTQYLNGSSGSFTYSLDGIRAAIARNTPEVQRVVLSTPVADEQIVYGVDKNFPDVLTRYVPGAITLRYHGP